ncbi:MAG: C25 family cysteine peptidase [archaeon]
MKLILTLLLLLSCFTLTSCANTAKASYEDTISISFNIESSNPELSVKNFALKSDSPLSNSKSSNLKNSNNVATESSQLADMTATNNKDNKVAVGNEAILDDSWQYTTDPGMARFPVKVYYVALPPGTDLKNIKVKLTKSAESESNIEEKQLPVSPVIAAWPYGIEKPLEVKCADKEIKKNNLPSYNDVKSRDQCSYPTQPIYIGSPGKSRDLVILPVYFYPLYYDSSSNKFKTVSLANIEIEYPKSEIKNSEIISEDTKKIIYNKEQMQQWYTNSVQKLSSTDTYDFVIITTEQIKKGSNLLNAYVAHKESLGFKVKVVTENDFDPELETAEGNARADKIREWLKDNYQVHGIQYVLLIGNPDPRGDIPMKMCWPFLRSVQYKEAPTDYYYADLTGNWDLNNDGNFCVYREDTIVGGVDLFPEVYVGRIPVYNNDYDTLDKILLKTIRYENEPGKREWRKNVLLPMSFLDDYTDGGYLGENIDFDILLPNDFNSYKMYENGAGSNGRCQTSCSYDESFLVDSVRKYWGKYGTSDPDYNPNGIVVWMAHGNADSVILSCQGSKHFFKSDDRIYLNDEYSAHLFSAACSNALPESQVNLAYSLLRQGAVSAIGASRVAWYTVGELVFKNSGSVGGIAYNYVDGLVSGKSVGMAFSESKSRDYMIYWFGNLLVFNLYGDPSIALYNNDVKVNSLILTNKKICLNANSATQFDGFASVWFQEGNYKLNKVEITLREEDTQESETKTIMFNGEQTYSTFSFVPTKMQPGKKYIIETNAYANSETGQEISQNQLSKLRFETAYCTYLPTVINDKVLTTEKECNDNIDNDKDGLIDIDDFDCCRLCTGSNNYDNEIIKKFDARGGECFDSQWFYWESPSIQNFYCCGDDPNEYYKCNDLVIVCFCCNKKTDIVTMVNGDYACVGKEICTNNIDDDSDTIIDMNDPDCCQTCLDQNYKFDKTIGTCTSSTVEFWDSLNSGSKYCCGNDRDASSGVINEYYKCDVTNTYCGCCDNPDDKIAKVGETYKCIQDENCYNGIDDDMDSFTDMDDPDCCQTCLGQNYKFDKSVGTCTSSTVEFWDTNNIQGKYCCGNNGNEFYKCDATNTHCGCCDNANDAIGFVNNAYVCLNAEICNNGIDDDMDSFTDMEDPDCCQNCLDHGYGFDKNVGTCTGSTISFWNEDVYPDRDQYKYCCGNNANEYYKCHDTYTTTCGCCYANYLYIGIFVGDSAPCDNVMDNYCIGIEKNINDLACIGSDVTCVFSNQFVLPFQYIDLNHDQRNDAICVNGAFRDFDGQANYCLGLYYIAGGENHQFGEYNSGTSTECCGDDADEFRKCNTLVSTDCACCDSDSDTVSGGVCSS